MNRNPNRVGALEDAVQVPSRKRAQQPHVIARGPMSITCPACDAGPAWSCANLSRDEDGNTYVRSRLKHPHPERRQAWRERKQA
jgi:hypothetical protein